MADDDNNQYNDEYQFTDLDVINSDSLEDTTNETTGASKTPKNANNIRRNGLIALGLIVLAFLAYNFLGPLFTSKRTPDTVPPIKTAIPQITQPVIPRNEPAQLPITTQASQPGPEISQINQRLSVLESNQQGLRAEMDSLNNQLMSMNSSVNELTTKIGDLNQTLSVLASKVDQQSNELTVLTVRMKPKPVKRVVIKKQSRPIYYIQAVIPGRAWLIATNGSTITVREGTQIAGYGLVKLIDSKQGKVITSSGQVIRFSQQDS